MSWTSYSARPTSASTRFPDTTSSPTGTTRTGCGCTTSTRGPAIPSSASTASRPGRTSTARCCRRSTSAGLRVVVPDYAGFGRSDKPTDRRWYSYDRHVEYTAALLGALDLRDATVVVQDWGGPIGLRWAVENAERVARLVILNTGLFTGRVSKGFMAWRDFAERNPDLPVGFVLQSGTATELADEVFAAYEAPFPTPESKAGAAQFPLLVPTSDDQPGATEMRAVTDELSRWDKPALVAFSDEDPVFPYPRAGERFTTLIPSAGEQVRIEGAAHFLQEDRGERIAELVLEFVRGSPGA